MLHAFCFCFFVVVVCSQVLGSAWFSSPEKEWNVDVEIPIHNLERFGWLNVAWRLNFQVG